MKRGPKPAFDAATIALAMELRSERIGWKLIARCLGDGIKNAVHNASHAGVSACVQ